jgi:hypothetical protein
MSYPHPDDPEPTQRAKCDRCGEVFDVNELVIWNCGRAVCQDCIQEDLNEVPAFEISQLKATVASLEASLDKAEMEQFLRAEKALENLAAEEKNHAADSAALSTEIRRLNGALADKSRRIANLEIELAEQLTRNIVTEA